MGIWNEIFLPRFDGVAFKFIRRPAGFSGAMLEAHVAIGSFQVIVGTGSRTYFILKISNKTASRKKTFKTWDVMQETENQLSARVITFQASAFDFVEKYYKTFSQFLSPLTFQTPTTLRRLPVSPCFYKDFEINAFWTQDCTEGAMERRWACYGNWITYSCNGIDYGY